jgi:hypothetical protein
VGKAAGRRFYYTMVLATRPSRQRMMIKPPIIGASLSDTDRGEGVGVLRIIKAPCGYHLN